MCEAIIVVWDRDARITREFVSEHASLKDAYQAARDGEVTGYAWVLARIVVSRNGGAIRIDGKR